MSRDSNTCYDCGTRLKSSLALMNHRGSRPCQLAKTQREMASRGWAMCNMLPREAGQVLALTDIEYEVAPGVYFEGGMEKLVMSAGKTLAKPKQRFHKPTLDEAVWCPAWAVPIVELTLSIDERSNILNTLRGDEKKIRAFQTALALGGTAAIRGYTEPALKDEDE